MSAEREQTLAQTIQTAMDVFTPQFEVFVFTMFSARGEEIAIISNADSHRTVMEMLDAATKAVEHDPASYVEVGTPPLS